MRRKELENRIDGLELAKRATIDVETINEIYKLTAKHRIEYYDKTGRYYSKRSVN